MPKLRLALLLLLAPLAHAQTTQWVKLVPAEDASIKVTFPSSAMIRWCDVATGLTCSPAEPVAAATTLSAYCPLVQPCADADSSDGLHGLLKDLEIQRLVGVSQTVIVTGTAVPVPAIPPPSYAAFSFVVGNYYHITVSNQPAPAGAPLQGQVSIWDGDILIATFSCTYNTVAPIGIPAPAGSPQSFAAIIGCLALPVPNQ